jgi:hypothetical protein
VFALLAQVRRSLLDFEFQLVLSPHANEYIWLYRRFLI